MVKKDLLEKVNKLGVPMMMPEERVDAHQTLAEVVKSHDTRLWESFPVLLAAVSRKQAVDFKKVRSQLRRRVDQKALDKLSVLSQAMYTYYHLHAAELNKSFERLKKLSADQKKTLKALRNALARQSHVPVGDLKLSAERLKNTFEDYLSFHHLQQQRQNAKYKELSLEYALSQVFSPKQKELFFKKLNRDKMTKTESEYYSRTVKKKVQALANPECHRLAQKLMEL